MKTSYKPNYRVIGIAAAILFFLTTDIMEAQAGHMHRATRRRTAVVVHGATQQQDQQQAAAAQQAQAPAPAPAPAPAQTKLPLGTIVQQLPGGCVTLPDGDAKVYQCGADYYREAYQGNNLVYITSDPPK